MKQTKLDIVPPVIERKCQWVTCDKDFAYRIDECDLCFEHGSLAIRMICEENEGVTTSSNQQQLRLGK